MRPGDLFRSYEEIKARYIKENFEARLKNFKFLIFIWSNFRGRSVHNTQVKPRALDFSVQIIELEIIYKRNQEQRRIF
jgi:hypothetical protein